jgi:hypothetical protein
MIDDTLMRPAKPNKEFVKIFNSFRRQGLSEQEARRWALEKLAIQKEWAKATKGEDFEESGETSPEEPQDYESTD